jgi:integrase/recombinase XerD
MDLRQKLNKSIARLLKKHKIAVTEAARRDIDKLLEMYEVNRVAPPTGTMAARINQFIAAKRVDGLSLKTLKDYEQQLKRFSARAGKAPERVTTDDVRKYIAEAYDRGLKVTSVGTIINTLKSFFSWLTTEELIRKNPLLKIKPINVDTKRLRKALSQEDIERLRASCVSAREKAIFEMFYSSGCRLTELLKINQSDINYHERELTVIGKGNKERVIFFSIRAKLYLQDYLANRSGKDDALFTSSIYPFRRLKTCSIQRIIRDIGERCGIRNVHPHLLRHSFAQHVQDSGMDIVTLQVLLGHDKIDTTQIYAKSSYVSIRHAYNMITF